MSRISVDLCFGIAITLFMAIQANQSRCFQFTWLGPGYNNDSVYENATCDDATGGYKGTPCVKPLVVSYDGSRPDVDYIWKNYPEASCSLSINDVCAHYTYYFNGRPDNSSHFCTRAVTEDHGLAITSGCHEQVNGSYTTRVCFCRSVPGGIPCNNSVIPSANWIFIILVILAFIQVK